MAGATVQWLRDGLKVIQSSSQVEALATSVVIPAAFILCPRSLAWAPRTGSSCAGNDRGDDAGHDGGTHCASRAGGYCLPSGRCARRHARRLRYSIAQLRVDGGAAVNDLLMQFQADLLQAPVVRPKIIENHGTRCRVPGRPGGCFGKTRRKSKRSGKPKRHLRRP